MELTILLCLFDFVVVVFIIFIQVIFSTSTAQKDVWVLVSRSDMVSP